MSAEKKWLGLKQTKKTSLSVISNRTVLDFIIQQIIRMQTSAYIPIKTISSFNCLHHWQLYRYIVQKQAQPPRASTSELVLRKLKDFTHTTAIRRKTGSNAVNNKQRCSGILQTTSAGQWKMTAADCDSFQSFFSVLNNKRCDNKCCLQHTSSSVVFQQYHVWPAALYDSSYFLTGWEMIVLSK